MNLENIKPHLPWITLIVLVLLVGAFNPGFLKPANLLSLMADIMPLFIMALGMTFAIYIGGIDLSAQQIANMVTVIATVSLAQFGLFGALICIFAGMIIGAISGFITTKLYVPSFVSTLALGFCALSFAEYLSGQRALYMDASLRDATFGWMVANFGPIPMELVIGLVLLLLFAFVQYRTKLGRQLNAVGAGEIAAVASGLNVDRIKITAFAISAGLAAVAGLLFSVKLSGGSPTLANGFLLPAIVAVLVGGTPLTGGVGGVVNTAIGTMIVAVIRSAMLYFNVNATAQQVVFGLLLIFAIALTIDRSKMRIVK